MEWPSVIDVCGVRYIREDAVTELQGPAPDAEPEPVFTAAQVSEMSGVSIRTVYNAMDRHVLDFKVPNGCTKPRLVPKSAYERWIGLR